MSYSDIGWRRNLYAGVGLSVLAVAILMFFAVLQMKNNLGMAHGGDWVFSRVMIGIQLFIAAILFGIGSMNRRDHWLTKILLVFVGIAAILMGLLGLLAIAMENDLTLLWKAVRVCAIDDIIIGILVLTCSI